MSDISDMMYEQGFHDGYQQALSELNGKKFEKVTRCKDCKLWAHPSFGYIQAQLGECRALGATRADWFCADGERKDGDGDGR